MNTKLLDIYWDYLKKISALPITTSAAYTVAAAQALKDVIAAEPLLSRAANTRHSRLRVDSSENMVESTVTTSVGNSVLDVAVLSHTVDSTTMQLSEA